MLKAPEDRPPRILDFTSDDVGVHPIDGWTLLHILTGATMALLEVSRPTAYAIIGATEVAELALRRAGSEFFEETGPNVAADLAASIAGFEAGRRLT